MRDKKKKHNKIVMLARSKLNSIESKISEALINNEISHEDFRAIINEERNYRERKESIRMMNTQRRDTEKYYLIEEGKKEELMELLNAMNVLITVKSLKSKTMLSYCLKCRKNTENISSRVSNTNSGKTMILSKCAICGSKK